MLIGGDEHCIICKVMFVIRNLEDLPSAEEKEQPAVETFLKIQHFNTDIEACLADPKMALSYQTGKINTLL